MMNSYLLPFTRISYEKPELKVSQNDQNNREQNHIVPKSVRNFSWIFRNFLETKGSLQMALDFHHKTLKNGFKNLHIKAFENACTLLSRKR